MDEASVRQSAEEHGQAVAAGDLRTAAQTVDPDYLSQAGKLMEELPSPLRSAEVLGVEAGDGGYTARTRYAGDEEAKIVESRWEERDGEPKMVDARVAG